jgi:hypothetical protein
MQLVEPQNQILPGIVNVEKKSPSLTPLRRRMGLAYDKLLMEAEEREGSLSPKTIRTLGKLVLEFEQVNTNLASIQAQIRQDIRDKKRYFDDEKKLYKKEEENLTSLRGSFFDLRSKFAGISAVLAGKALLEGRFGDAAANAGFAVTAMLPEIVNIASGLVLSRMALGGMGRAAAGATIARGGGVRMPGMGGLGMLGLAAAVPLTMGAADVRRQELVRRQTGSAGISPEDVDRFQATVTRFDAILSQKGGGGKAQEQPKAAVEEELDKNGKPIPKDTKGNYPKTGITIEDEKRGLEELGVSQEQYNAYKQGVADIEGARYNQMGGAGGRFAGRYQMGAGEIKASAAIMGIPAPSQEEYLSNPELQEKIYMGRTIYMHRRMMDLSPKYRDMSSLERLKVLGGGQLGEGSLQQYLERGTTIRDSNNVEIQRWIRSVERRLEGVEIKPKPSRKPPSEDPRSQSMQFMKPAGSDISLITLPGQQKVVKPQTPKSAPASSEVAFNTTFESVDRFTSNLILGVYSS